MQQLKTELAKPQPQLQQCASVYSQLKIDYAKQGRLFAKSTDAPDAILAVRDFYEIGAQLAIKQKDLPAFERAVNPLSPFYFGEFGKMPPSQAQYPLIGLWLLNCLVQSDNAEFHVLIERILSVNGALDAHVQFAIKVEQCLMEGRYAAVSRLKSTVPSAEYAYMLDQLLLSLRNEIAACVEVSYATLPIADCCLLMNVDEATLKQLVQDRKWQVSNGVLVFQPETEELTFNPTGLMENVLQYAKELERIV